MSFRHRAVASAKFNHSGAKLRAGGPRWDIPLEACDAMTFRVHVAAYRTSWTETTPELILDHRYLPVSAAPSLFLPTKRRRLL
jgi:hypothetical protein